MAAKAMERAEGKIDEAGFYHLTLGAGIMIDNARLLAGESTENIGIQISDRRAAESLDALAAALAKSLIPSQEDSGDSRPPILVHSDSKK